MIDTKARQKFMATCFGSDPGQAQKFKSYATTHIDWKWEFLSKTLEGILPVYGLLQKHFDKKKILHSDSGQELTNKNIHAVGEVLKKPGFPLAMEMYLCVGNLLTKICKKLEGCDCHEDVKKSNMSRKRKLAIIQNEIGCKKCVWSGRRSAWWAAKGREEFYSEILQATTPSLQAALISLTDETRTSIVSCLDGMRLGILEELKAKFKFFDHVPYSALGVLYCAPGGSVAEARDRLRRCMREYDAHCPDGKGFHMHRVAHIIFSREFPCRHSLENFLHGDGPLEQYPRAFVTLQEYALTPLVTRLIEGVHAMIKRAGKSMTFVKVPYLCSLIRESRNIELLRKNTDFSSMVLDTWLSRSMCDQILCLRCSPAELKNMTSAEMIGLINQSSWESNFKNAEDAKVPRALALAVRESAHLSDPSPSEDEKTIVAVMKEILEPGSFFCSKKSLFELAQGLAPLPSAIFFDDDPMADILEISNELGYEHMFNPVDHVIFRVLHSKPEDSHAGRVSF